jgi:signal transduction histidine kinase/CheY-like chemotaxis protein/GAF domain-containing protein
MTTTNERWTARPHGALAAIAISAAVALVDWLTPLAFNPAPIHALALFTAASTRDRRLLWTLAVFVVLAVYGHVVFGVLTNRDAASAVFVNRTLVSATLLVITYLLDRRMAVSGELRRASAALLAQNAALEASNRDLIAHEGKIARQNEQLQSQSEQLECQSEELRVANDDLASRERMLARLLSLSRALASELSTDDVMATICEALAELVGEQAEASALLMREEGRMRARCHSGFGPDGPIEYELPYERSFAARLLSRGQAGFLVDVRGQPDVVTLRLRDGEVRSVLGAPITVRGRWIGTLEVYSRSPTAWTDEQVRLVTSMAAQASLSLETSRLFEEMLREKRRFETVFRTLPVAVFACDDAECRTVIGNPAAARFFGAPLDANFSPSTPFGAGVHELFHRGGRALVADESVLVRAVRQGEEIEAEECEVVFPGGRRATVISSAAPFYDAEGRVTGGAAVLVDVTRQKNLERDLDARRRESEEESVRKTRFLAAVSHDIRTPANVIRLQAELIRRAVGDPVFGPRLPDLVQTLERNAIALVDLVGDVLDITRFDSGQIDLQEADVSLGDMIAEECGRLVPVAAAKGLALDCDSIEPPIWVRTDRVKLGRVLGNLIENAIKFTEKGGVRVAADVTGANVEIRVSDTGDGIPAEHHGRIFDEFFQLRNPERDHGKGRGLGLAICKRLVEAMGGAVGVEKSNGVGTTFLVTFPADRIVAAPSTPDRFASRAAPPAAEPQPLRGLRVLLVDDHADSRRAVAAILGGEGALVTEAADGRSALQRLAESPPDVLLLDLRRPDVDGVDVLKTVRANPIPSLRAVIVVTGDGAVRSAQTLRSLGAALVLDKPVEPTTLVASIRRFLDEARTRPK